mgnify:CR=1 FL=1
MAGATIAVASDHAGFDLKELLKRDLQEAGYAVLDLGTNSTASVDYPDFGRAMGEAIAGGKAERGVLVCGSGIGISIAANRNPKVRAVLAHDVTSARLSREHNDANVISIGGRMHDEAFCLQLVDTFLTTPFTNDERHVRRIGLISGYEESGKI